MKEQRKDKIRFDLISNCARKKTASFLVMHSCPIYFVPLFLIDIPQDAAQPGLSNGVLIVKKRVS